MLGRCQLNSIGANGTNQKVFKIMELDNEQRQLTQVLEGEYVCESKWYIKGLNKSKNLV